MSIATACGGGGGGGGAFGAGQGNGGDGADGCLKITPTSFLLKRDLIPSNDNTTPIYLNKVA